MLAFMLASQVLDARDPMGSRAHALEAAVAANPSKKLVLVLNKVSEARHTKLSTP